MKPNRRQWLAGMGAAALLGGAGACSRDQNKASSSSSGSAGAGQRQRILILGGTGFVGPALVEAALLRGHRVTLFNRGRTNPGLFGSAGGNVETILGDRMQGLAPLKGRDWDAVVDTWAPGPTLVRRAAEFLRDHVGQYVFLSTISVYKLGTEAIDESSPVLPLPPGVQIGKPITIDEKTYGPLKAVAEQAAEESMPGRACRIRAGVIVGPGDPSDRFIYWPLRLQRGGEVLVPGTPADRMQFIDARDLGAFFTTVIEQKHTGAYNAVGPTDPSLHAVLAGVQAAVPAKSRLCYVPTDWLAQNQAEGWGDFPLAVAASAKDSGFARVSAARALAHGLRLRPPEQTARDALAWWNTLPAERRAQKRPGLTAERETELLARWHARAAQ